MTNIEKLCEYINRTAPGNEYQFLSLLLAIASKTEKAPGTAATMQGATQKNKLHNHSTVDQAVCQVSRWGEL